MADLRIVASPIPDMFMQKNSLKRLGKIVKGMKASRIFLITDGGLVKAGVAQKVIDVAQKDKIEVTIFADVVPNPTVAVVEDGARRLQALMTEAKAKDQRVCVVTLGGGSSMDAGKAIAMLAGQAPGESILDYVINPGLASEGSNLLDRRSLVPKKVAKARGVPKIIAIPTTSGTASETNGAGVITDTTDPAKHRKLIFVSEIAKAAIILLDPALTVGVPRYATATCGMDVLTHALEAFTSNQQNPYSAAIAKGAIEIVARHLRNVVANPGDLEGRAQMHLASHMAGVAFNMSNLGLCHAMGHPLSALYNKAHGQTLATMLPHIMRFNLDEREVEYAEVARIFGVHRADASDQENALAAIDAIAQLSIDVGTAKSVRDLGGREQDIPTLVQQALTDLCMLTTPLMPSPEEVAELYRGAMDDDALYPKQLKSKL